MRAETIAIETIVFEIIDIENTETGTIATESIATSTIATWTMTIRTAVTGTTEITSQGSPFEVCMVAESLAMLGSCIEMLRM